MLITSCQKVIGLLLCQIASCDIIYPKLSLLFEYVWRVGTCFSFLNHKTCELCLMLHLNIPPCYTTYNDDHAC